jgi:hypothetical protein
VCWQTLIVEDDTYKALMKINYFRSAYDEFHTKMNPNVKQKIRYFNIALHSLDIYLLERGDPTLMGLGETRDRTKAINRARDLLELIRGGLHFGALGINENRQLTMSLERYKRKLESIGTVRIDDGIQERRFLKLLILEFLMSYNSPLKEVITNFYYLVVPQAKYDSAIRVIDTYIDDVRSGLQFPESPVLGTWYSERS